MALLFLAGRTTKSGEHTYLFGALLIRVEAQIRSGGGYSPPPSHLLLIFLHTQDFRRETGIRSLEMGACDRA